MWKPCPKIFARVFFSLSLSVSRFDSELHSFRRRPTRSQSHAFFTLLSVCQETLLLSFLYSGQHRATAEILTRLCGLFYNSSPVLQWRNATDTRLHIDSKTASFHNLTQVFFLLHFLKKLSICTRHLNSFASISHLRRVNVSSKTMWRELHKLSKVAVWAADSSRQSVWLLSQALMLRHVGLSSCGLLTSVAPPRSYLCSLRRLLLNRQRQVFESRPS